MHICHLLLSAVVFSAVAATTPVQKRDADFLSVRTKNTKDMSGRGGDPPRNTFVYESIFHPHYDGRFAESTLNYTEQKKALRGLVQAFLVTFNDLSIETWLMHGTLLGWWWNKQILPWDSDIDVQVSETSMFFLAAYYNMSVFYHRMPGKPKGREYLLEVNPHYQNRGQTDKLNVIDARWIDMESGLFIDITTVRYNMTHPAGEGMMSCKDGHEFRDTYLFPLRSALFEGVRTKIPYRYRELLVGEYGEKALSLTEFKNHRFDDDQMEWIPVTEEMKSRADL